MTNTPVNVTERRRTRGRRRRPIQHPIEYGAFRLLLAVFHWLPHGALKGLCAAFGAFYGFVNRVVRTQSHRAALLNLKIAFPEKSDAEHDRILRSMWRSWGRYVADSAYLSKLTKEQLLALIDCDTDALYEEINATAKKRGVLILTGHFGSFELFHSAMAAKGTPISLVHRATNNPYFDVYLDNVRQRFGTKTLVRGDAAREIVRELRSGGVVAIPFDQVAHAEIRVFAPFFGIDASTNSGLARLALRTGAAVYPAFLVRTGTSLRHRAVFGPPVELARTGDLTRDVVVNTCRFNEVLERFVREHPDHWIWMYRRWRKQPEGLCSPYIEGAPPLDAYRAATAKAHAGD